jgi:hypothetical protein
MALDRVVERAIWFRFRSPGERAIGSSELQDLLIAVVVGEVPQDPPRNRAAHYAVAIIEGPRS